MMTWPQLMATVNLSNAGSVASVVGLVISFLTFVYVLISKKAARKAVDQLRDDFMRFDAVADFTSAIATMDEIKRLHREGAWSSLPERYSALRKHLISIKGSDPGMPPEEKKVLQAAILQFTKMEEKVEGALSRREAPDNAPQLNSIVRNATDRLQAILVERRNQLGR